MSKINNNFFQIMSLGYPNAQISPAKISSLVDDACIASSRFAFFGGNLSICLSHYYSNGF
ncbi:MAG: hypothetical protein A2836_00420 [Candidatus Taylorbacteria bacterium RIFCSPHIGHO2_01_FULL_45_63]|uniref:Uncharacterized protein n=1 Tax=Candidatus Taylorbacteria bacterium RIFCSPHIGHO2_02_FULL_45_35 TaxID=1802311 RepID=A0A1G2MSC4_9BACT|nr:MAG: hypothetical protein A2836_00420 [Candidatus Taylorbacteria bacterium RIFCSPHIGHO2_01_FULL_45_63]OHA26817.1 MAG: hypothetical protein A3D56_02715 [Candidatus Taylorbacteria bacterium RIFCSPHIGHO2_02_FULL_45_35]OHA33622.1 MAG: hypothetical protein A3A22_03440 [Candidatus Taylorbacteria bacterium RIFCSPLOWO2_01_FULL_45_34b]